MAREHGFWRPHLYPGFPVAALNKGVGAVVYDLTKIIGAANARDVRVGMAMSHTQIPDSTLEDFVAANCNYLYHFAGMHWGSMFPAVGSLSTTNEANVDEVIDYAVSRNLKLRWHALTWYFVVPSDIATALAADFNGTHDTWFQWVADKIAAKGAQLQSVEVFNEKIAATGIGYRDEVFTQAKGGDAVACIAAQMERARLIFPTTLLSGCDNVTVQGSDTYHNNATSTLFGMLDDLEALDPAFVPDIWNEQLHVRHGQAFNQDRYAKTVQEFKDRGLTYNFSEIDTDGDALSTSILSDVFDVWNDLGAGDTFGTQGSIDDGSNLVFYDSSYAIKSFGQVVLDSLVDHPVLAGPSYIYLDNYSVVEPSGDVGTIAVVSNPLGDALTYSVQGTPIGGTFSVSGDTLHADAVDFDTAAAATLMLRVADEHGHAWDWNPDTHEIAVVGSNLFAPGVWAGTDKEGWTTPASVTADNGLKFTATPVGSQARKAFPTTPASGRTIQITYDLVNNNTTGTFVGSFRIDLNNSGGTGSKTGTNRSAPGSYTELYTTDGNQTEVWLRSVVSAFTGKVQNLVVTDVT